MKFFVALILAGLVVSAAVDEYSQFLSWKSKYQKTYTGAEHHRRFANFQRTLRRIGMKNNGTRTVFGLNGLSDLSEEEFRSNYLMKNTLVPAHDANVEVAHPVGVVAPASFDWRNSKLGVVTPVKDQGQCGSCWAFSVAETVESANILAGKANASLRVSEQQIVDCDQNDDGCDGGNPETAYQYIMSAGGLDSESSYPYTAVDGTCSFKPSFVVAKISGWKYATTQDDETTLQNNLLLKPVSICVDAANWQDYSSGVMTWYDCAWVNVLDHCVQLVGYSTTDGSTPYWIVRNSWSTSWGEQGYIRLEMGENTCGLTNQATIPSA